MAQDWTDSIPNASNQWESDIEDMRDNFTAIKSSFSGATAPANPVAGMWWFDTTANFLKVRDEANNTWLSVWDLANNKPVITNLSAEITLAMMAAACADAAAGTASLRTLSTTGTTACAGNDPRLSDTRTPTDLSVTEGKLGAAAVAQAKLKTSTGAVSTVSSTGVHLTLPGGEYGFYPQIRHYGGSTTMTASIGTGYGNFNPPAYATIIYLLSHEGAGYTVYAQQRYVTSSGEIFWIFILRDKITKKTISTYSAPDHPCFGNGGKPLVVPHPFGNYDPSKHEIIIINPSDDEVKELESKCPVDDETKPDLSLIEVVNNLYEIDEKAGSPDFPKQKVTVGLPANHDWKRVADGAEVSPIKKVIPKMDYFITRTLRLK